jgi:hypothetical protein
MPPRGAKIVRVERHPSPIEAPEEDAPPILPQIPWATLLAIWCAGSVAAFAIAGQKHIPLKLAAPIAAAFLLELTLWASLKHLVQLPPVTWVLSALVPYLVLTLPLGLFHWSSALLIAIYGLLAVWRG